LPAGAALSAPAPAITRVDVFPVSYPVAGRFKFLGSQRYAVFVKITCESGAAGWGQSVPLPTWSYETPESVATTLEKYLAPVLIGRNPFDIAGAHQAMNRAIAPSFSTGMPIAKAGVDLALHDLAGRLRGQSAAALWGRKPLDRIPLSWTVNPSSLDAIESLVEEGRKRGYSHFNVKVAPDPKFDVELCRRVRKLAPNAFLWADANGGYDLETALAVAPKLADIGVNVLEQPLPANRLTGYRDLKKQGALPILMDEGVVSSVDLAEFIRLGLLDGVAMKPARTGGLWEARLQVEMLERENLMFLGSGLTDPDTSLAASLQLYCAYHLKYPAALNGPQFLEGTFLRTPIEVKDGAALLPAGLGLGVEVDEERVASARPRQARSASRRFTIEDVQGSALRLSEGGAPVLVYNYGMQLKEGVPERYRRSSYVHPLYTPGGTIITDDFPADHYHHRGLSWMWPRVIAGGQTYNLWEITEGGIRQRFVRWLARETSAAGARIAVENAWEVGSRPLVRETVELAVHPAEENLRRLDLTLTLEALDEPVAIGGTLDLNKGYGGLCLRFAPRENTVIRTEAGREPRDTDMVPHPWAELEGTFAGRRARARIEIDPGNPGFPNGWCLRHYGFLGVNFPGLELYTLLPGKPLKMRYRIVVS